MSLSLAVLLFVTVQRIGELVLAAVNTALLKARGAHEYAAGHYPVMMAMHTAWLAGLWHFGLGTAPDFGWLVVFVLLEMLRAWVLATLAERWTTRIIILPGAPLVTGGPYRFLAHPNYCVVAGEILVLPLAFHLVWFAVLFSLLNAAMLCIRVRAENRALGR
ncbi:MAG: hypothetical protein JO273_13885 [Methylobacteriaceae bacterium]|nr:hypothetical protein [Methylobacteriaceae bacterium]